MMGDDPFFLTLFPLSLSLSRFEDRGGGGIRGPDKPVTFFSGFFLLFFSPVLNIKH